MKKVEKSRKRAEKDGEENDLGWRWREFLVSEVWELGRARRVVRV